MLRVRSLFADEFTKEIVCPSRSRRGGAEGEDRGRLEVLGDKTWSSGIIIGDWFVLVLDPGEAKFRIFLDNEVKYAERVPRYVFSRCSDGVPAISFADCDEPAPVKARDADKGYNKAY